MKYLGIDWGMKKIGLAIGDDEVKVASPFGIIKRTAVLRPRTTCFARVQGKQAPHDIKEIGRLIEENEIKKIIIGRPVSLGGDMAMKQSWQTFVNAISGFGATVQFEDERLSTKMAQKLSRDFSFTKKKQGDDDVAAEIILQSYFDRL